MARYGTLTSTNLRPKLFRLGSSLPGDGLTSHRMRISLVLALALAFVVPPTFAQKPPAPAPPIPSPPPSTVQQSESRQDLVMFLVGRVAASDGTAIPYDMMIDRVCNDKV